MAGKKKKHPAAPSAIAVMIGPRHTPEQVVAAARQSIAAIKQNPDLANHPDLQAAVTDWGTKTDLVDTTEGQINTTRALLDGYVAAQAGNVANERRAADKTFALINFVCNGSAAAIKGYGAGIRGRMPTPPSTDPPVGLVLKRGLFPGSVLLKWRAVRSSKGYFVQTSTNPNDPNGWSAPVACPLAKYEPTGLTTGQTVYFRVAVQRSNGIGQYSGAVSVVVP
jgi:hypothetical protein